MDAPARSRRVGARALDGAVLVWVVGIVVVEIEGRLFGGDPWGTRVIQPVSSAEVLAAVLGAIVVLEWLPLALWGRTIGKAAMSLRVVRTDRGTADRGAGFVAAGIRTAVLAVPLLVPVGGLPIAVAVGASALVLAGGRGIPDRLAGTTVVTAPPGRPDRRHRYPRRSIEPLPLPDVAKAVLVDVGLPAEIDGFFAVDRRMAVYDEMLFTVGTDPVGMAICVVSPEGEVVAIDPDGARPNRLVARDLPQLVELLDAVGGASPADRASRLRAVDPDAIDDPDSWWRDRLDAAG